MNKKIKVALGTMYPINDGFINGGVEAVALYLTQALARRDDIELHVVSCVKGLKKKKIEVRDQVIFHWLPTKSRFYLARATTVDLLRVRREYEEINPDLIHAQGFSEYALASNGKIPLLLSIHGIESLVPTTFSLNHFSGFVGYYRRLIGKYISLHSLQQADAIICNSGKYVTNILESLLKSKKKYYVFNPIADDFFHLQSPVKNSSNILWVGNIHERKNLIDLIRAFAKVVGHFPETQLLIVGEVSEPGYQNRMVEEIQKYNLQTKIRFLGKISQSDLLRIYQESTLFVMTSIEETAPMALAQAMAAGKPIVATRVGGIPWMVEDGRSGVLVTPGDIEGLSDAIRKILSDKNLQDVMGKAGKLLAVEYFSATKVAERTTQVYFEMIKGKNG